MISDKHNSAEAFSSIEKLNVEKSLTGQSLDTKKLIVNELYLRGNKLGENLIELDEDFSLQLGEDSVKMGELLEMANSITELRNVCGDKLELCFLSIEEERELLAKMVGF